MTRKSYSRQQRDSKMKDARQEAGVQIKDNKIYDDIQSMYNECGRTLIGYSSALNELKINEHIEMMSAPQINKVKTLISGFARDVSSLTDDLVNIRKPFENKSGGEPNLDKFIDTVGVVEQFGEFIGRTKGLLDPTFRHLAAEVTEVNDRIQVQLKATDPAVITDVEVKG